MSKIEVDAIDKQSGSTLTIGGSGTTVQLGTGASQTGFGREGSVNWQTGSIKTTTFTAVSGEGYFVDTSSGAVTANLPAGSAGAIVAFADYTRTFNDNNFTISPNGSNKIGGIAQDAKLTVNGQSATFVFVDATEGWINVQETQTSQTGAVEFMAATGGTVTTVCTNFKVHTFTSPGTFCVSQVSTVDATRNKVDYLVVAGGGAGGSSSQPADATYAGGGGAGGYRESDGAATGCYATSPIAAPNGALPVSIQGYPITVGGGGTASVVPTANQLTGGKGSNSIFSTITSTGGGVGRLDNGGCNVGSGGSGGGGGGGGPGASGAGNTPTVSPPQGNPGGSSANVGAPRYGRNGGGGATAPGTDGTTSGGGAGGAGATSSINGTPTARAGGGGGGYYSSPGASGGSGGSGGGGAGAPVNNGTAGTVNTGGGGGGASYPLPASATPVTGGSGGSGIVIVRYRFQ